MKKGLKTKTDASGAFTIHQDEEMQAIANRIDVGYISVNNGMSPTDYRKLYLDKQSV
jgi:hypothetical protein